MLQPTSVPPTIQGPCINLSPSYLVCLPSSSFLKCRVAWMSCTPCQTAKPACPNKSTLPWLIPLACWYTCFSHWGLGPKHVWEIEWSKFSCQDQSKHPWKQGKGDSYCEVAWLPCGSSAKVFQKLPSDREILKVLQVLNGSLGHSQNPNPNREKCVFFLLVCVLTLI